MVVECDAELSADIGQLGWADVPGAPRHLNSASKGSAGAAIPKLAQQPCRTPLSKEALCAAKNSAPSNSGAIDGHSFPKSVAFATSFHVNPWI